MTRSRCRTDDGSDLDIEAQERTRTWAGSVASAIAKLAQHREFPTPVTRKEDRHYRGDHVDHPAECPDRP
jgi:hypothetical protein